MVSSNEMAPESPSHKLWPDLPPPSSDDTGVLSLGFQSRKAPKTPSHFSLALELDSQCEFHPLPGFLQAHTPNELTFKI